MEHAMVETIENAVIPEPELEVEVQPDPTPPDDSTIEKKLAEEISDLWSNHIRLSADRKMTSKELRQLRLALAERLFTMKSLLSRPGRNGFWRSWLLERHIPRSTADRLVSRHVETMGAKNNVPSEATSEPTKADIMKFFYTLWPRIRGVVTTHESALTFLGFFVSETCMRCEWREDGLMVFSPDAEEQATEDEEIPTTEQDAGDDDGESGEEI